MALRAATLTLGLFLAACGTEAGSGLADGSQDQPPAIAIQLQSAETEPTGVLTYGDEEQAGQLGTHCWAARCVDFAGPPVPSAFTSVPGDASIELRGDGKAEAISVGTPPEEEF